MFHFFYSGKRVNSEKKEKEEKKPSREEEPSRKGLAGWWQRLRKGWKAAIISSASVVLLVLITLLVARLYIRLPDPVNIIPNLPTPGETVPPSGMFPVVPSGEYAVSPSPAPEYISREGVYTVLLAGENEGLTDTLMVATLDTVNKTCHVLSIPRDTVIGSAGRSIKKINSAYSYGKSKDPGMQQLKQEVATIIGFQPQYYALVGYKGFVKLIDTIKGVDFYVPMDMYVPYEGIDLKKGQQTLWGEQALQLVRFRYDPVTKKGYDDYGRMETQQKLVAAVAKKCLANWSKVGDYISIAQEYLLSDLDYGQMLGLAEEVSKIGIENITFSTLPTHTVNKPAEIDGNYYEVVNTEEALALINKTINPFTIDITGDIVEHTQLTER